MDDLVEIKTMPSQWPHYYGDAVRRLFFFAGIIMLITIPSKNLLPAHIFVSLVSILIVDLAAALTNPRQRWIIIFDAVVAAVGLITFEYNSIVSYDTADPVFWINQILALIFFLAFYFSIKTIRARMLLRNRILSHTPDSEQE